MAHFKNGTVVIRGTSTPSSGGTLTLATNSETRQRITGTQPHIVKLPPITTSVPVGLPYTVMNRSTDVVTVVYDSNSLAVSMNPDTQRSFTLVDNTSSDGTWDITDETGGSSSLGIADLLAVLSGSAESERATDDSVLSTRLVYDLEEIGGDFFRTRSALDTPITSSGGFSVGGVGYRSAGLTSLLASSAVATLEEFIDDGNYWRAKTSNTTARGMPASFATARAGFLASGTNAAGTAIATTEKYDPVNDSWALRSDVNTAVKFTDGTATSDLGYKIGGDSGSVTSEVEAYNDTIDVWYVRSSMTSAHKEAACFTLNDYVYEVGGHNGSSQVSVGERYDEPLDTWIAVESLPSTRKDAYGYASIGFGYAAGGFNSGVVVDDVVQRYNDFNDSWATVASLLTVRANGSAFVVSEFGYVSGGDDNSAVTATVEQYVNVAWQKLKLRKKKTRTAPLSILVGVAIKDVATSGVPVQVRTDGDSWKTFVSNQNSAIKTNEEITTKFLESPHLSVVGGYNGSALSTLNQFYNPTSNLWVNSFALTTTLQNAGGFAIHGDGYAVAGYDGTSSTATNRSYNYFDDAWVNKTALGYSVNTATGIALDGFGYMVGGDESGAIDDVTRYNADIDTWFTRTSLPAVRGAHGAAHNNGRILAMGGWSPTSATKIATAVQYDAELDAWTAVTSMSAIRAQISQSAFQLGFYAYAPGGESGSALTSVERYDSETDTWATVDALPVAKYAASGGILEGYAYLSGGNSGSYVNTVYRYNDAYDAWETGTANLNDTLAFTIQGTVGDYRNYEIRVGLPTYVAGVGAESWLARTSYDTARGANFAAVLNGSLYSVSGPDVSVEKYDYENDIWKYAASVSTTHDACAGFSLLGRLYAASGSPGGSTAEYLNDELDTWIAVTNVGTATPACRGGALNSYGYKIGGDSGSSASNVVEQYNPITNTWTAKASISVGNGGTATPTLKGLLYSIGGFDGSDNPDDLVEQYNDVSDAWITKQSLTTPRWGATAISLEHIVVVGGSGGTYGGSVNPILTSAEEYNEVQDVWNNKPGLNTGRASEGGSNAHELNGFGFVANGYITGAVASAITEQLVLSKPKLSVGIAMKVLE